MLKRNRDIDRRGRRLKNGRRGNGPVIYWLERDQRVHDNWALLWAQQEALLHDRPLEVVFCFDRGSPGSGLRANLFQLSGCEELRQSLSGYHIGFTVLVGDPKQMLPRYVRQRDALLLCTDFNPLKHKRGQLEHLLQEVVTPVVEIDAHNIIPAWLASDKQEYAAYTIRPKIQRLLHDFLTQFPALKKHPGRPEGAAEPVDAAELGKRVADRAAFEIDWLKPGEQAGRQAMEQAVSKRLHGYDKRRNDPCQDGQSDLSPYLHFGQLSAQRLALAVGESELAEVDKKSFLEELIVRRELSDNFCLYQPDYDCFAGFPQWARKTLEDHRQDPRSHTYNKEELEQARTHEPLWNACQHHLVHRGKMPGYLRMYWAKKLLEWTAEPEQALAYGIALNDRYSLDGCDPNGYVGVAWSVGGVHDRAWPERPVFGKVRYMNERGCRRKFDVDGYIAAVLSAG